MVDIPFYWLDIFTSEPFKGNPAAVCLMKTDLENNLYQKIAGELKLSETAFTDKIGPSEYKLRWFTPELEMPLCGHATMATAYTLAKEKNEKSPITFHTLRGELLIEVEDNQVTLNFPKFNLKKTMEKRLLEPLGVKNYVELLSSSDIPALWVVVENMEHVEQIQPDFKKLREVCRESNMMGAVVVSKGKEPYDFVYRVFAPSVSISEDQGTGIVQCGIAPYWMDKLGKTKMRSLQLSERISEMSVEVMEKGVRITGTVTPLIKGMLSL